MRAWLPLTIAVTALSVVAPPAFAQGEYEAPSPAPPEAPVERPSSRLDLAKEHVALGFDLMRPQDDFGIGATVSSPSLAHWFRFTLGGGIRRCCSHPRSPRRRCGSVESAASGWSSRSSRVSGQDR
ncbi:MAG TPA: hypothetical protein VIF09_04500 [Polyangiaceae bacterium]